MKYIIISLLFLLIFSIGVDADHVITIEGRCCKTTMDESIQNLLQFKEECYARTDINLSLCDIIVKSSDKRIVNLNETCSEHNLTTRVQCDIHIQNKRLAAISKYSLRYGWIVPVIILIYWYRKRKK